MFYAIPPRAGPATRKGVGCLDDPGFHGLRFLLVVVRSDSVYDLRRPAQPFGYFGPYDGVRAFDLVVYGLANVVQQRSGLGDIDVGTNLAARRSDRGCLNDVCNWFDLTVLKDSCQKIDEFGVHPGRWRVSRFLALLFILDPTLPGLVPPPRSSGGYGHRLST